MNYMEMKKLLPSRMEGAKTNNNFVVSKKTKTWENIGAVVSVLSLCLVFSITVAVYYLLGYLFQYMDPTAGWLDIGTFSLPLFAAWCCLLGVGIAGLLPAVIDIIGRKGGMEKWKADKNCLWQVVIYLGYIVLLCVLL